MKKEFELIESEKILMRSVGLFSSFCYYKPNNILFDCGDGTAQFLNRKIFAPNIVALSHCHLDHVGGLPSLIGLRNKTMGDNTKELVIVYPKGDKYFKEFEEYLLWLFPHHCRKFNIHFVGLEPGEEFKLDKNTFLRPFKTIHTKYSQGYLVFKKSMGIKKEFQNEETYEKLCNQEINRDEVMEEREIREFAYTLDNCGFDTKEVEGVQEIVLDCTFLDEKDRHEDSKTHCTKKECEILVDKIKPKKYHLAHISPRYKNTSEP